MKNIPYVKSVAVPKHVKKILNEMIDRIHALEESSGNVSDSESIVKSIEKVSGTEPVTDEPVVKKVYNFSKKKKGA